MAEYLDRFARERNLTLPPLGADGVGMIQRGSAVVTIHVLADKGVLLLLSRVAKTPALDAARYKQLLEASFVDTGDAAFALHPQTGDLYLRILRGLDGLDYEEFEDIVHSIAQVADKWDDKLA
ncbi:MAG: type III secretion system chaperone [Deltaproteobacteria bacterium]|nr:type III secretion system chaperone [Deltaproteobacteria bacterium]